VYIYLKGIKTIAKQIDTLVEDIYDLFRLGANPTDDQVVEFASSLAATVRDRLQSSGTPREPTLRMSNLGKPDRQLWYEFHPDADDPKEELEPHTLLKFLIGDLYEEVLLFLAKVAGHDVSQEQGEVEVDGIKGHIDAVIDGHVVDVKSASTFAFKKFKNGTLAEDDPFGYIDQIGGYSTALGLPAAFLAGDKQNGHITLLKVPQEETEGLRISDRIEHLKEVIVDEEAPERCYEAVPEGASGNMALSIGCSYCPHKFRCWSDSNDGLGIRTFLYSTGPKHLVEVVKEPKVPELTF
jgi:hypothetical protein